MGCDHCEGQEIGMVEMWEGDFYVQRDLYLCDLCGDQFTFPLATAGQVC